MIDISVWMDIFLHSLDNRFGERVWFVGLQGSYGRGEATESSDIDPVVILDELTVNDLLCYRSILEDMPHREKICGFISGRQELLNWEPSDLFQFYYDTIPVRGTLDDLLPLLDGDAVDRAIKTGVCNIYHGCVHNMLHDRSEDTLRGLYKAASFVIQAICFQQTGTYIRHQKDLLDVVCLKEWTVLAAYLDMKDGKISDFQKESENLFLWSKNWIER